MLPQWKNEFGGYPGFPAVYPAQMVVDGENNSYLLEVVENYSDLRTSCHDPILRKVNSNGQTDWYKDLGKYACSGEYAYVLKIHNEALYLIYSRAETQSTYPVKLHLAKYTLEGDSVWSKVLGDEDPNGYLTEYQIDFDNSGNIYASGL